MFRFALGAVAAALLGLAGCQYVAELTLKTCDDPGTLALLESILSDAITASTGREVLHDDFAKVVHFQMIHPVKLEENIGKYSCEGKINLGSEGDKQLALNLSYSSQLVNDQHLVEIDNGGGLALLISQALSQAAPATPPSTPASTLEAAAVSAPAEAEEPTEPADQPGPEGHIEACSAVRQADGKPYSEAKAILLKSDFWPANAAERDAEAFPDEIDGDPANCGNHGCEIQWSVYRGARTLSVGVTIDESKGDADLIAHVDASGCGAAQ